MNEALNELKHSITQHMILTGGIISPQLGVFLLKIVDFLETDEQTKIAEMSELSYLIIKGIAVLTHTKIDTELKQMRYSHKEMYTTNDKIMTTIKNADGDYVSKKNQILQSVANSIRAFSKITNSKNVQLTTSKGDLL